ncbi:MAG: RluA family pseudouridine synthase, partial [Rhodobiaceae bacterium]|nr:RluA family pseudouridine synthase [Rhodobiaceae bacterium]
QTIRIPPHIEHGVVPGEQKGGTISPADAALLKKITLYEDDDLLILNKPAGLAVQGGTKTSRHIDGMLMGLTDRAGDRPRLVHRLDRDTSGVLVIAKTRKVSSLLGKQFATRSVRKIYWALVKGVPKPTQGKIDMALIKAGGPDGDRVRAAEPNEEGAQQAVTHYSVVDKAGQGFAWVTAKPVTGRQHQIRAHLAGIGHPIVGDNKYGGDQDLPEAVAASLNLHARRVTFKHPVEGHIVDVSAPVPEHMKRNFDLFGFSPEGRGEDTE